jgi:hypothetical protein
MRGTKKGTHGRSFERGNSREARGEGTPRSRSFYHPPPPTPFDLCVATSLISTPDSSGFQPTFSLQLSYSQHVSLNDPTEGTTVARACQSGSVDKAARSRSIGKSSSWPAVVTRRAGPALWIKARQSGCVGSAPHLSVRIYFPEHDIGPSQR